MSNCIENLRTYHREICEPCIWNAQIIEFEQLPEEEKYNYDYYDKDKDYLIYCKKCKVYKIIPSE
jgi:hypothetical protein